MKSARRSQIFIFLCCLVIVITSAVSAKADDCKRIQNILVLFDASGQMKDKDNYSALLQQMAYFSQAIPITADGFFNVGLRHWGLKVGLGCENTESILAVQPWDPERFMNAFPKTVSYGVSSFAAGLKAAADDVAGLTGKTIILVVGAGTESCKADPIQIAERMCQNNPDLEIHAVQIGGSPDGRFYLKGIAEKCRGVYTSADQITSSAPWYAWMKRHLVTPCAKPSGPAAGAHESIGVVTFDSNNYSLRSKEPSADAANMAALQAVANAMRANPAARVILHGFSDGKGKADHNLKLSKKRAEAVAHHLISAYKVPSTQISIIAHGSGQTMLQAPSGIRQDRFGRRVEFEIVQ